MQRWIFTVLFLSLSTASQARVVVFWQSGFPTHDSKPVSEESLRQALGEMKPAFLALDDLKKPGALQDADLLVLPYGSAFPADAWKELQEYLQAGGNLLSLGGRPLFVPVFREGDRFAAARPQNTYSRRLGIWHSYEVPQRDGREFRWDDHYTFLPPLAVRAERVFVAGAWWDSGDYRGMGHLLNAAGDRVAAPIVREDFRSLQGGEKSSLLGARVVMLNFDPEPAYWSSADGQALIRAAAEYASQGASFLRVELAYASVHSGESAQVTVQVRNLRKQRRGQALGGEVRVDLLSQGRVVESSRIACAGETTQASVAFHSALRPGLYEVRAAYEEAGKIREAYRTGFWVRDDALLKSGTRLEAGRTYFRRNGAPFAPVGANYFTTDEFYTGFLGSSNAAVWERDFADMEKHGVTFVRTGVWNNHADFLDKVTGGAEERILRSLEAFLLSATKHNMQVHFTFFAFDPQTVRRHPGEEPLQFGPGTNPYTDPVARRAQKNYIISIVERFKDVPNLTWDLINEPSFSNPKHLWRGNTPNADPTEITAWNEWLKRRYGDIRRLAEAWGVPSEELEGFGTIALPEIEDLSLIRYGSARNVRALDYNLFAQEMFVQWAADLIAAIRSTGSRQLVAVGQDEGGVSDRVLNQFYGASGVAFTVNHTWWRDDALLWDSVAAKRPGLPNLIGETGIQPVWNMDGTWRWDEVQGLGLFERKLALGFAAGNSGSLQWDWAAGDAFGIKRADGSNKLWLDVLAGLGEFARRAAPYLTDEPPAEVAIVLPQSLQLSVFNSAAIEAQQKCVRALYHYARSSARVVGEYQIELLGDPKLIILPSPWVLNQIAWDAILAKVRAGATVLVSGRFDLDEHFHPTLRQREIGLDYRAGPLATRENPIEWPGGKSWLTYSGDKTTHLERAFLESGRSYAEVSVGLGKILYFPLPLELNDNLPAIGDVYRFALQRAQVKPTYTSEVQDAGILICPTRLPEATLYVVTSESSSSSPLAFVDSASGRRLSGQLPPGRAALLLLSRKGEVLADYNWTSAE
jgi:hypothetical protein